MTTATRTTSGFPMGLCFAALLLAAVVLGGMAAMPVMQVAVPAPPAGYYEDAELAEIATTKMIVLDIPDEGPCEVAVGHISKHGVEAVQAVRTGGWKKGDCGDGPKSYSYKLAEDGRWWIRIKWEGKVVTCYRVTWDLLLYYFKSDGCNPPRSPFSHDGMSAPAY